MCVWSVSIENPLNDNVQIIINPAAVNQAKIKKKFLASRTKKPIKMRGRHVLLLFSMIEPNNNLLWFFLQIKKFQINRLIDSHWWWLNQMSIDSYIHFWWFIFMIHSTIGFVWLCNGLPRVDLERKIFSFSNQPNTTHFVYLHRHFISFSLLSNISHQPVIYCFCCFLNLLLFCVCVWKSSFVCTEYRPTNQPGGNNIFKWIQFLFSTSLVNY